MSENSSLTNFVVDIELGWKYIGTLYASEEEFMVQLRKWEDETKTVFYKRSSTNIQTARKKSVKRCINPNLPYQVLFCCIHGGRKPNKRSINNSRNTRLIWFPVPF